MNKAKLILLGCPVLLASMLLVANPAQATEVVLQPTKTVDSTSATPIYEVVFEQQTPETPMLAFTDQESDESIARYGCDCTSCLNSLRQLQGKLPLL